MQDYSKKLNHFKLVHFEDILSDPFGLSKELYKFIICKPMELERLRLKSKKVIKKDGSHEENYGKSGNKYRLDKTTIKEIFKPDLNDNQINNLSAEQISDFNTIIEGALKFFSCKIIT